jgi:hypothetical protein
MLDLHEIPQDQVIGHVVRLERTEAQEEGTIVIDGYVGKTRHQVKIALTGENYQVAIRAHDTRQVVVASGTVVKQGRSWWLVDDISIAMPLSRDLR